jgi:transposase-like protein
VRPGPEACHDEPGVVPVGLGEGLAGDNREGGGPGSGVHSPERPIPTREQCRGMFAEKCDAVRDALRGDASPSNRAMARKFGVSRDTIRKLRNEVGHGPSSCRNGSVPPPPAPSVEAARIDRVVGPEVGSEDRLIAEKAFVVGRFKRCPEALRGHFPAMLRGLADELEGPRIERSKRAMD